MEVAAWGSSPLTRGKLFIAAFDLQTLGLIPAHAGKTDVGDAGLLQARAHPRSRGENSGSSITTASPTGSSPLTRGKLSDSNQPKLIQRLIPAHAGKTSAGRSRPGPPWAHPRSRGENDVKTGSGLPVLGSSPLTRGKHVEVAGFGVFGHGSSPLTRGKQDVDREATTGPRLIPAHAGKTIPTNRRQYLSGAHPRSRGENLGLRHARVEMEGSSPLTRGKPRRLPRDLRGMGLIPAHAGKTFGAESINVASWAHPRSRGENVCTTCNRCP